MSHLLGGSGLVALLRHMHIMADRRSPVQPSSAFVPSPAGRGERRSNLDGREHTRDVCGGRGREQLRTHISRAWKAAAIPAQVLAHGLKLHAIVEPLEVTG